MVGIVESIIRWKAFIRGRGKATIVELLCLSRRRLATDLGVSEFLAISALHLAPVTRLRTFPAEVAGFLAVSASDSVHVPRLVTLLDHVSLLAAVAARPTPALRAVFREVTHCTS